MNKYPDNELLSREEERKLLKRYKKYGDEQSRQKLINHNAKLVIDIAFKNKGKGVEVSDLIQEGMIGLMIAIEKFDLSKENKLATFATSYIIQKINQCLNREQKDIRVPNHIYNLSIQYSSFLKKYQNEHNEMPTDEEIMEFLDINSNTLTLIRESALKSYSLELNMNDSENKSLKNSLQNTNSASPEQEYIGKIKEEKLKESINEVAKDLPNKPVKKVMKHRRGLDNTKEKTLVETGEILGVSREWVRIVEKQVIARLKNKMKKYK